LKQITIFYLLIGVFWSVDTLATDTHDSNGYSQTYMIGLDSILTRAMNSSRELKSAIKKHQATEILLDSEVAYYYPKVSLGGDFKKYYTGDGDSKENVSDISLTVKSKIYGDAIHDKVAGASDTERGAYYEIKSKENEIYYTVVSSLSKIERSRLYIHSAAKLREEMLSYLELLRQAIKQGVSPISDLKKADLVIAKFDDDVFTEKSNIERYFYELEMATEIEILSPDDVGISVDELHKLSSKVMDTFEKDKAITNNFKIISKEYNLSSLKHQALSQNENLKLSLINETYFNTVNNNDGASFGQIKDTSYLGLRLDMVLFDDQRNKRDKASYIQYLAEKDNLNAEKEKIKFEVELLHRNYRSLSSKITNIDTQMNLSRKLIKSQKNDLWIDRVTQQDLIATLSSLNQEGLSLLALDLKVYETIYKYWELKSEAIF